MFNINKYNNNRLTFVTESKVNSICTHFVLLVDKRIVVKQK